MKLRIFDEKDDDNVNFLRLKLNVHGGVDLVVVDPSGIPRSKGHILSITDAGFIKVYNGFSDDLGFPTDSDGFVKVIH